MSAINNIKNIDYISSRGEISFLGTQSATKNDSSFLHHLDGLLKTAPAKLEQEPAAAQNNFGVQSHKADSIA